MALGQSINSRLKYITEITEGTTPAAALTLLRNKGSNLNFNIASVKSTELVSHGALVDTVPSAGTSGGSINMELSFAEYRPFFESALRSSYSTAVTLTAATISASSVDNSYNDSGLGFSTANILPGMVISVSGFANAANNGLAVVVSVTTGKIVVSHKTLVTAAAAPSITIKSRSLRNGTTQKTFSIEEQFTDTATFRYYKGQMVDSITVNASQGQIVEGSITLKGGNAGNGVATIGTGADLAASTNPLLNATSNMGTVYIDGVASTYYFKNINLTTGNQSRERTAIASLFPINMGSGTIEPSLSISAFYSDETLFDKLRNNTPFSLLYNFTDSAGNVFAVYCPRVKIDTATQDAKALNTDIMQSISLVATQSPTLNFSIQISEI